MKYVVGDKALTNILVFAENLQAVPNKVAKSRDLRDAGPALQKKIQRNLPKNETQAYGGG